MSGDLPSNITAEAAQPRSVKHHRIIGDHGIFGVDCIDIEWK